MADPLPSPLNIALDFEGQAIPAVAGEPVAVALWRGGERTLSRSVKYHRPRGLSCFEEACAGCLVRIDGLPNRFACSTPAVEGMRIDRQNAFPDAGRDLLRAVDFSFPKTFNHHEMLAGVPVLSAVMAKVARQLAGLGELPDAEARAGVPFGAARELRVGTLLVGVGRAGRAQAAQLGTDDLAVDVIRGDRALGVFLEGGRPVVAVDRDRTLLRVVPERLMLCTGSRAQIPAFDGSDRPGVLTDRAAAKLLRWGVRPDAKVRVAGDPPRASAIGERLALAGAEVEVLPPGALLRHRKGTLVVAGPLAPAFELAGQAGAALEFVAGRGYAVATDAEGQTSVPWLKAFGSCAAVANG